MIPGIVHLMAALFIAFSALIIYVASKHFRRYLTAFALLVFAVDSVFLTVMYSPYYVVAPIGTVEIPTNYTTVVNSTTSVISGTLVKTVYTPSLTGKYIQYIGIVVALVASVLSFIFMLIAAYGRFRRWLR